MKTSTSRRKILGDAVDRLADIQSGGNTTLLIPLEKIKPFRDHPFRLYEGQRLQDMVDSIKEHGVLVPVIVIQSEDEYETLAGHNRINAAKLAGLTQIPAIIKKNLTEEEAYVYVIETNVIQRSFSELLPSEKAAVLAMRYEKVSCQGKRRDIIEEIAQISGVDIPDTCGHDVHKSRSRDTIGEEYGMTGRNIARYLRIDKLNDGFKQMVDTGKLPMVSAVELSYLKEKEQRMVQEQIQKKRKRLTTADAAALHKNAGKLTVKMIQEILEGEKQDKSKGKISSQFLSRLKEKYFKEESYDQMASIIEQALEAWFAGKHSGDMSRRK